MNVHTHTSTVALIWTSIHTLIREALPRVCAQTHALRLFTHTRYPRPKYNIGYSNIQSRVNILFHSHQSADCWFTPTPWLTYGWQTTCKLWQHDPTRSDLTCGFAEFFFFFFPQLRSAITQFEKIKQQAVLFRGGPWLARRITATQHGDKQVRAYEIHKALCRLSVCVPV